MSQEKRAERLEALFKELRGDEFQGLNTSSITRKQILFLCNKYNIRPTHVKRVSGEAWSKLI